MRSLALASCVLAGAALAAPREIPFWPDAVPDAIRDSVNGQAALETVRSLGRFHRVHGSPGFAAAADFVRDEAKAAGLEDATVEHFPADGETRYAHFRSYYGWSAEFASLDETAPQARPIARFPELPVALADYSQDADVTAPLVSVGAGSTPADYDGKDVKGRLVLASGPLPAVHRMAVEERGALGFLSDFPNQTTAWSGDDRDLVRRGHLDPYQTKNAFAFMLSKRQAEALRARLAKGEAVTLHAVVKAKMVKASFDVVSATIPGTDPAAGEVVLTAHLCHQSAGANDNASGSAAILEVARALSAAIRSGAIAKPKLTIRFLWLPEIAGSQAWLARHPDVAARIVAGIHMDMVGGLLATTKGTFHLSRSAESLPHVVNAIARPFFDEVSAAAMQYAERGGDPREGFVSPGASREAFLGDLRKVEQGSDHDVFQAAGWAIPMVYFHDWPDVTIHTNKDQPENLDATKLQRVAYMGAGIAYTLAALPDAEAPKLLAVARAEAEQALAAARLTQALAEDPRDGALAVRETLVEATATLGSLAKRWPSTAAAVKQATTALGTAPVVAPGSDARVPVRSADVRGPLDVYYYDYLAEALRARGEKATPIDITTRVENAGLLSYEALNLADGTRSVSEIRDVLTGRYGPVAVASIADYFGLLAKAGIVSFKGAPALHR